MRISDWSSDVCSSDLSACRRGSCGAWSFGLDSVPVTAGDGRDGGEALPTSRRSARSFCSETLIAIALVGAASAASSAPSPCDGVLLSRCRLRQQRQHLQRQLLRRRQRLVLVDRSEEHTSELQSLMRISYAVFCLKKKKNN